MQVPLLSFALLLARPCLCSHLFNSRDSLARSVIETCRSQTPNEKTECYNILRCILDNIPSDYTARWSAGASILAFIPTIVALMSNSINEVTSIADESVFLATALSLSSITAFNSRFGMRSKSLSDTLFEEQRGARARIQSALSILEDLIAHPQKSRPWWQNDKLQIYTSSLTALVLGAGVWYEVYEITRYGIVAFACPVKANVGLWVGLSQLLALLNVLCRTLSFDVHTIQIRTGEARTSRKSPPANVKRSTLVLRCHRNTFLRWLLQTFTAIASFSLYAYGTTVLASMTLIPASDAIRVMVVAGSSAGFGRLVGYWFTSTRRRNSEIIVVDVPADCAQDFVSSILSKWSQSVLV